MSREYVLHPFRSVANLQIDYAKELNPQQHAAVTAPPGPSLVIAGAGAGKTRTLVYRAAFLLEQGIPADRILLLTFTNKAAREMMRRVTELLGVDNRAIWGGTFHSIGHRILRRHADLLGYGKDFTILDREDSKDLIKACVADSSIETTETLFPKPDVLQDIFSLAANTCQSVSQLVEQNYEHFLTLQPQIETLSAQYAARKRTTNVMDFDDLQTLWLRLLRDDAQVREQYQRRFQFVLVDEYQDTNAVQGELIDLLAQRHQNLTVVGDDSQSIYSWRGANFRNILEFPKRYPKAQTYKIEVNYRSVPEILAVANAAIKANVAQFPKELAPVRGSGSKPVLAVCGDASEQAGFVAQRVLQLREEGVDLQKMAVLYRSHFHAMELQLELTRRNIPFSITSGQRFFEQAHVKDLVAYLKFVCNPVDELAFKRIAMLMPGIGAKGADKLWRSFLGAAQGLVSANHSVAPARHRIATALQGCAAAVPKKAAKAWSVFAITVSQLEEPALRKNPAQMTRMVLEAGYDDYLKETYPNFRSRKEDLEQLANFAHQFESVEDFLAQLSLLTNLEAEEDEKMPQRDDERLRLSTIHQAKGLEFDVVFVIMLCDGLFPSSRSLNDPDDEEEERRLFYVAITRARNELYLTYPLLRFLPGYSGDSMQQPSRFLHEIPRELLDEWSLRFGHRSDLWHGEII